MNNWNKLPFIVKTTAGLNTWHAHYFESATEALSFRDWLISQGLPFSLLVKD